MPLRGAILALWVLLGAVVATPAGAATFRGTVVDRETGHPLEGAVAVVVWWRLPFRVAPHVNPMPYKVVESLTDAQARLVVDASPGFSIGFWRRTVVVYKPGYRPRVERSHEERAPLFAGDRIALAKITTRKEALESNSEVARHVAVCGGPDRRPSCVARADVPRLLRLLGLARRIYGAFPAGLFMVEEDR